LTKLKAGSSQRGTTDDFEERFPQDRSSAKSAVDVPF
jgi:hypothetical protein